MYKGVCKKCNKSMRSVTNSVTECTFENSNGEVFLVFTSNLVALSKKLKDSPVKFIIGNKVKKGADVALWECSECISKTIQKRKSLLEGQLYVYCLECTKEAMLTKDHAFNIKARVGSGVPEEDPLAITFEKCAHHKELAL